MIDCHSRVKTDLIAQSNHVPTRFSTTGTPFANQSLVHAAQSRSEVEKRGHPVLAPARMLKKMDTLIQPEPMSGASRPGGQRVAAAILSRVRHLGQ
jgi:hypothetical protein